MPTVTPEMSSSSDADQASSIAARTARDALLEYALSGSGSAPQQVMIDAILSAHSAACEGAPHRDPGEDPPGTTIVAALVQGRATAHPLFAYARLKPRPQPPG